MIAPATDGITVYSTNYCPFCTSAKRLLTSLRLPFEEVDLTGNDEARNALVHLVLFVIPVAQMVRSVVEAIVVLV